MNIKKLVCFFALLALCCTYPFALVNEINCQDLDRQLNDNGGGVGGNANEVLHYKRHIFTLKFMTQHDSSTGYGNGYVEIDSGTSYYNMILSCCIHTIWWKTCDFSFDDMGCYKYIDREKGKPYDSSTYFM